MKHVLFGLGISLSWLLVACGGPIEGDDPAGEEEEIVLDDSDAVSSASDLNFGSFSKLDDEVTVFRDVRANYIVYAESHGRDGHNDINHTQSGFVDIEGATLVGYGGGRDKYLALFRVNSSRVTIDKNGGSAQALFVSTSKRLTVTEARSIDPSIGSEKVPGARNSNEIVVYAEDEGGKGERDAFYMPRAHKTYGTGDDLLYVFIDDRISGRGPNGNGAYMRLTIR
jgi:hypothetical protein